MTCNQVMGSGTISIVATIVHALETGSFLAEHAIVGKKHLATMGPHSKGQCTKVRTLLSGREALAYLAHICVCTTTGKGKPISRRDTSMGHQGQVCLTGAPLIAWPAALGPSRSGSLHISTRVHKSGTGRTDVLGVEGSC